ncbi:MAG TPA: hypothetical protein VJK02_13735 [Anaerolineales bacterium]|nr:hypothetical protein [Anaerolineales bacterium]
MKLSEVYPSKYVKAEDLDGDADVVIKELVMEEFEDPQTKKRTQKPVLYFQNARKGLICNKTNAGLIARLYGDETDEWVGKHITLTVVDVEAFGDVVSAIRIKLPKGEKPAGAGLN